ncbi:DUF7112 family protein [Halomarina oriensis]|uniref:Uncharacterized protein n=1 Tax=Halomarina oriensis TaxID=671145 RepID=A0A6B0GS80_9EURY|nr:hypothetical protein [Halomarina oriensis]MWG34945.1 hypothetical protein [Halomarina oriensis]
MADRIQHDHASVVTHRATLERAGRTSRPKLVLPDEVPARERPVRLVLDGSTRHATIEEAVDGTVEIRGAYDNARMAREREGENHLVAWAERTGLDFGRSVHLDAVDDELYGVRAPGERAVYTPTDSPNDSLSNIANDLDE